MKSNVFVALVLTAGGLKEIYDRNGKRLPFWYHWPFLNKRAKELEKKSVVTITYKEKLKSETVARLQKASELFKAGKVSLIFSAGGFSPRRQMLGLKDSVEMMKDWLVADGVSQQATVGEAMSVDTGGNIEEFIQQIKKLEIVQGLTIYLVTSWYHLFRGKVELSRALKKEGISANIICVAAFPKFDAETLKYEYAFNLLFEPLKLLSLLFPGIKTMWRKSEYEAGK